MAYSQTLELVQGDTNPQITVTLRDSNSAAPGKVLDDADPATWATINITGGSVRLKLRMLGSTTVKDTLDGTIADPANGIATFLLNPTTLDTAGIMEGEIEYTDASDRVQSVVDLLKIKVREQF